MTKFDIQVCKSGSRIHFFMSLAGINPVMGDSFVIPLINMIGPLTNNEIKVLKQIKDKFDNLPEEDRKSIVIESFYPNGNACLRENHLSLLQLMDEMDNKFEVYWKKIEKQLLQSRKTILEDLERQKSVLSKGMSALVTLFGENKPDKVSVFLVPSPIDNSSGKYITENVVYVEIPEINQNNLIKFWLLLLHEIIHASYESFEYKMWLKEFAEKQAQTNLSQKMGPKNLLRELVDAAIAPNGYFSSYLYSIDIKSKLTKEINSDKDFLTSERSEFNYLKKVVALNLFDEIDQYLKSSKEIDEKILTITWQIILDKKILPH